MPETFMTTASATFSYLGQLWLWSPTPLGACRVELEPEETVVQFGNLRYNLITKLHYRIDAGGTPCTIK